MFTSEEYKWNDVKDYISHNIAQEVKSYILHEHFFMSLTREDYMDFRKIDVEPMTNTISSHTEPPKPMSTSYGHTMTEFRQPLQVQSHLEMPGILVQLGHIQCT